MSTYSQVIQAHFRTPNSLEKRTAMKKLGVVLILWACTLPLSACAILETSPCYGTGCPVLHSSKNAPAAAQNAPAQPAQDNTATTTTPAQTQKKHHHKFWIL
jgi:hypothetical protein